MVKRKRQHYVDNKEFFKALVEYNELVNEAEKNGEKRPRVPNYIGSCFQKIAEHLSYKPNFINYTYRDEMISDGVENCLLYMNNFDPEKSNNPFAYFTRIIFNAFLRRIEKENKLLYTKYKSIEYHNMNNLTSDRQDHDYHDYNDVIVYNDWSQEKVDDFIENFENKLADKKMKARAKKGK